MTPDKKKALLVYALGILTVSLCVGAALLYTAYENCSKRGGTWGTFTCSK